MGVILHHGLRYQDMAQWARDRYGLESSMFWESIDLLGRMDGEYLRFMAEQQKAAASTTRRKG